MKTLFFTLVFLVSTFFAYEEECCPYVNQECCTPECIKPLIEFRAGYFFFQNHLMSKVFRSGGLDLQFCGSYPIWKWLQIYGSVEYLQRHGRSLGAHEKTNIYIVPLNLGLKASVSIIEEIQYYLTLGPRYSFVHVHNHSHFVDRNLNENGIGGFVGTGFNYFPIPHLVIDVFGEYSYTKLKFHPHKANVFGRDIQVGGFTFGGGIGYAF